MQCSIIRLQGSQPSTEDPSTVFETVENLAIHAAREITAGRLVAFPSETVYGLGANGVDEDAVNLIFEVKGRPKSDPCILHVDGFDMCHKLVDLTKSELSVYKLLTDAFWPGPLSIAAKAHKDVPRVTMGGGDKVACRMPNSSIIRAMISQSQVPIAGPSANKFGRISPTTPAHVISAFYEDDITVIDDGSRSSIGIESTVLRLEGIEGQVVLTILRRGAITKTMIDDMLKSEQLDFDVIVNYNNAEVEDVLSGKSNGRQVFDSGRTSLCTVREEISRAADAYDESFKSTGSISASPGTSITHYAPLIPCLMVRILEEECGQEYNTGNLPALEDTVYVSIDKRDVSWEDRDRVVELKYDAEEAIIDEAIMAECFDLLHRAEAVAQACGAQAILIPVPELAAGESNEKVLAVYDRLYRAASGKICNLVVQKSNGRLHPKCLALGRN